MGKKLRLVALLTLCFSGVVGAQTVDWISGFFAVQPPSWTISPANPTSLDTITFEGPTDTTYGNPCAARGGLGGTPYITIDHVTKIIELKFQGPAPTQCTLEYNPTVGLSGDLGILAPGNWVFKCTHVKIPFTINFTVSGNNIIYVDENAPLTIVPPNGSSWVLAYHNLQDGLTAAQSGDTIHVADGTYTPDIGGGITPGDRQVAFKIPDNVTVLGSFAGFGALDPDVRDFDTHPTILTGDLKLDDLWGLLNTDENSYHVVQASGSGTLDGVIITGGNANGFGTHAYGGGVLLESSTLAIENCRIHENKAEIGGGVACLEGITPSFLDTEITGNWATIYGGAIYNEDANLQMINCLITGNTCGQAHILGGDAIFNAMGSLDIINCTIADNRPGHGAPPNGRAIINFIWGPGFVDTISIKNSILRNGGEEVWCTEPGIVSLYNNNIEGGIGGFFGVGNIDLDPLFKNPGAFTIEGQWYFDADGYTLQIGSPSIDSGNQTLLPPTITTDLAGNPRVEGTDVDQGAYEWSLIPITVLVPNVVGNIQAVAEAIIIASSLTVGTINQINHATVPAGQVISQNPVGGTSVIIGSPVDLTVSLGPANILVPNVVGLTQGAAQATIIAGSLTVGTITKVYHATVPAGIVISQNPVGGTSVLVGSSVNITVSLGPAPPTTVLVPNVVGLTQIAAQATIIAGSLTVGTITQVNHATIPAGQVISQNPVGGTTVLVGSSVDLTVSLGPGSSGWTLVGTEDIQTNVPSPPPSIPVPVFGSASKDFTVLVPSEYKIEATGLPAVGGTWSTNPSTGNLSTGTTTINFSINGFNVDLSSLPSGVQKIGEVRYYTRPQ